MRISDWSSDVCSSDLQQTAFDNRAELRRTHVTGVETQRSPRVMFPDLHGLIWRATRRGNLAPHAETLQKRDARRCKCVNRSEERRVGKEWVSKCRSRGSPYH